MDKSYIWLVSLMFILFSGLGCKSWRRPQGAVPVEMERTEELQAEEGFRPVAVSAADAEKVAGKEFIALTLKPGSSELGRATAITESSSNTVSRIYPCAECGLIQLDKTMPKEVELNKPFDYAIKVTNLTDMTLTGVVITEDIPDNFEFTGAEPQAEKDANNLVWSMDSLGPKASSKITVSGIATDPNVLKHCATVVTHAFPACASVTVVHPTLELTKITPAGVLLCEPIAVKYVVTNSGTGAAEDVKIMETFPAGLQTADGLSELSFNVGTLPAGQSKQFFTKLRAVKTGKYVSRAIATFATDQKVETPETTLLVTQPVLTISKTGPERHYLGQSVSYEITVTNTGDAPAKNTIVEDTIPVGVNSIKATAGAKLSGSRLIWRLGTLAPNGSKKLRVLFTPTKPGELTSTATATAYCAEVVTALAKTSILAIPAIMLEVVDAEDPVEVGSNTTYVITVTNQGSADSTNIQITCTLEDSMQYVSSAGATTGSIEANLVRFAPLSRLRRKGKATWRVVVKAVKPADARFKVTLTTEELVRPVDEAEATRLYE